MLRTCEVENMNVKKITPSQKYALGIATIIALIFGAYFLRGFFSMFALAAIVAYTFFPVYRKLNTRFSGGASAAITLLVSLLAVIIPVIVVIALSVMQLGTLANYIGDTFANTDMSKLGDQVIDSINGILASIPFVTYKVTEQSLTSGITDFAQTAGSALLHYFTSTLSSAFSLISSVIIYLYIFMSLLVNHKKIFELFRDLNPLGKEASNLYLEKTAAMVKGTVGGQFIIAVTQGLFGALTIYIGGVHEAFFVLFLVLTLLSMIPLGGGILSIPIGIIMMFFGNFWGGLLVVGGHLIVATNIDNVLRPKLVPKAARLDSALMIVSVFSGIAMFGFLGIVIGPVIMILIVTTIKVYLQVYKNIESEKTTKKIKAA